MSSPDAIARTLPRLSVAGAVLVLGPAAFTLGLVDVGRPALNSDFTVPTRP